MYLLCILAGGQRLLSDLAAIAKFSTRQQDAAATAERFVPARPYVCKGVQVALVWVLAAMLLNAWQVHPEHGPDRPAPEMAWFRLEQLYRHATQDLVEREPLSDVTRIAAGDIGVVGFESGASILDTVGLVSPEAVSYAPLPDEAYVGVYAISTELILDQRPDYLIALEVYVRNSLLRSEQFNRHYELVRRWPTEIYGSDGLLVYRRIEAGR
jgi:hypothetical protein